jgi:gluconolactonase
MKKTVLVVVATAVFVVGIHAQSPDQRRTGILKVDPALDAIISSNAKIQILKEDYFGISEGPVWISDGSGYLLFSDIGANAIYKWTPDGKLSVFLEKAGYVGNDLTTVGNIGNNGRLFINTAGPNGLTLDRERRLLIAAQGDRAIIRIEKDGKRTVLADRFEGKRLNSPNDLVMKSDGAIYFSDPPAGLRGGANSPAKELDFNGTFLLKDGKVQLIEKEFSSNGLAFSPDEKYLYVNGGGRIMRYEVQPDDTVRNRTVFIDMTADKAPGGTDGMKVDQRGNVYCTGPGGIWIISPAGKLLGKILLPENATNLAFGDADGRGLYITDRRTLIRTRVNIPGVRP